MSPLEIISRLCDVTETLSAIVKKQQTIIEQSKIEETVKAELRQEVEETDREMDVLEYHMRRYCDTDDSGERSQMHVGTGEQRQTDIEEQHHRHHIRAEITCSYS